MKMFVKATLTAAVALSFLTGCESFMKNQHQHLSKPITEKWESAVTQIQLQAIEQQYKVGDFDKCRQSLSGLLVKNVPFAPLYVLAAKVELEQGGRLDSAQQFITRAIDVDPQNAEAYYVYGLLYQRWQKLDKACEYYNIAADKKPTDPLYAVASIEMHIALGQLEEARAITEAKLPAFGQSSAFHSALGRICSLEGDREGAVKHYREASLLLPEDKNLRWSYAQSLFDAGQFAEAAKLLEQLRKDPPVMPKVAAGTSSPLDVAADEVAAQSMKVSIMLTLAESYIGLSRTQDARDTIQEVIRIQPENTSAYLALGKVCLLTKEPRLTVAAAQKVLRTEPENVQAMILHAAALQLQKKWADAIVPLTSASRLAPKDSTILCMMGISELQLGKNENAEQLFAKAVSVNPSDKWANELLTRLRPEIGNAVPAGVGDQ